MHSGTTATGRYSRQARLRMSASVGRHHLYTHASAGRPLPPSGKIGAGARAAALPSAAFSGISNRNKIAFKNARNLMKTNAAPLSNRNTNPVSARPPQPPIPGLADCVVRIPSGLAGRQPASPAGRSPLTIHYSPVALYAPRSLSRAATHILSNRHSVRLEIIENPTKTPFSAILIDTFYRFRGPNFARRESRVAGHASRRLRPLGSGARRAGQAIGIHGPGVARRGSRSARHESRVTSHASRPLPPLTHPHHKLARRFSLPHNEVGARRGMKKSFILVLAMGGGLAGLAIGLAAGRSGQPHLHRLASPFTSPRSAAAPASIEPAHAIEPQPANSDSGGQPGKSSGEEPIIRFASNPQPMPPFLLTDLDGNAVSTAAWKGKVVFINFWATWCPPCRAEIPVLIDLASRYKDRLQIVGVSLDEDDPQEVKKFAEHVGINYPIVMASREIVAEYGGVPALPTLFVVNTDGKVVQKHEGLYSQELYETEVRLLLGLPAAAKVETFQDEGQIFLKNAALATELPDVDFTGLTPEQKKAALKRLNSETCQCGCGLTLAQCRINDTSCAISKKLAANIVKEIAAGTAAPAPAAPAAAPISPITPPAPPKSAPAPRPSSATSAPVGSALNQR
jgi:thiol-disulfide isomerase/thioredoxin